MLERCSLFAKLNVFFNTLQIKHRPFLRVIFKRCIFVTSDFRNLQVWSYIARGSLAHVRFNCKN